MDDTNKLIQDQFDSLPLEVKESIGRVPWKARINDIAKREGLDNEKSAALETETMLVLYGFLSPENYAQNIQMNVGTDEEQAERIEKLVGDEIVSDIEKQFEMIKALEPKDTTPKMDGPNISEPKVERAAPDALPLAPPVTALETAPANLPMVEPGEAAHEVPRNIIGEKLSQVVISTNNPAKPAYTDKDPYREPLE